jgi:uncharacterized protein YjiS (DUF1127 family)|tara:strand:- start:112 stop:360 length:249 start_codon:yes stop_codon:yes gene_type:complete
MEEVAMKASWISIRVRALPLKIVRNRLQALAFKAWLKLRRWQQVSYERRLLLTMSDAQMKDIGVSRAEAMNEAVRPFWDDKA